MRSFYIILQKAKGKKMPYSIMKNDIFEEVNRKWAYDAIDLFK